ncbi:MAG: SDR family NAD(P)-dependent oxidoreductase [Clostridia bacterium]|nr:SDR family NAD(P)-dependent oxidoreductase [Clostridia bacterium]
MAEKKKIAIVTGASSGLGFEFIKHMAGSGKYDEIWAVARRSERLSALRSQFGNVIVPVTADLTTDSGMSAVTGRLTAESPDLIALVNNAGFGTIGDVAESDPMTQGRIVSLNCEALTVLTAFALKYMKKGAFVLNVCSIAAFAPNPRMATYCSTKAYVLSFTRALRFELKKQGINACAVCPGPMETEFLPVAGIEKGTSKTFDTLPRCNPDKVAKNGLRAAEKGRGVYTPRTFFKFYRFVAKVLPHGLVMHMSKT